MLLMFYRQSKFYKSSISGISSFSIGSSIGSLRLLDLFLAKLQETSWAIDLKMEVSNFIISYNQYQVIDLIVQYTYNQSQPMAQSEVRLIDISLPDFINKFKDNCQQQIFPLIDGAIHYLNNTQSPVLMVLLIVFFMQLLILALRKNKVEEKDMTVTTEQRLLSKQIKDLKKQLKSIQNMLIQIKQIQPAQASSHFSRDLQLTRQTIQSCKQSLSKREQIADHILEWQTKIIEQVVKLKKKNNASRSASAIKSSESKIVSGTNKKKMFKSSINPIQNQHQRHLFVTEVDKKQTKTEIKIINQQVSIKQEVKQEKQFYNQTPSFMPSFDSTPQIYKPVEKIEVESTKKIQQNKESANDQSYVKQEPVQNDELLPTPTSNISQQNLPQKFVPAAIRPPIPKNIKNPLNKTEGRRNPPPPPIRR